MFVHHAWNSSNPWWNKKGFINDNLLTVDKNEQFNEHEKFKIIEFTQQCQAYLSVTNERGMEAIEYAKHEHYETFIMSRGGRAAKEHFSPIPKEVQKYELSIRNNCEGFKNKSNSI